MTRQELLVTVLLVLALVLGAGVRTWRKGGLSAADPALKTPAVSP